MSKSSREAAESTAGAFCEWARLNVPEKAPSKADQPKASSAPGESPIKSGPARGAVRARESPINRESIPPHHHSKKEKKP